jgi:hypothetical protein
MQSIVLIADSQGGKEVRKFVITAFALALLLISMGALSPAQAQTAVPPTPGPGLFVSSLRLSPAQPAFNQNVSFYATFSNTTSVVQNFLWKVYIFRADTPTHSNDETSALQTGFAVGTSETQSLGTFRLGPTGYQCEYFYAQVGWLDANNKITYFTAPDGSDYKKGFSVCDANIIPTAVPASPAATAVPPAPGPGLYINNLRLSPAQPAFNDRITFFATYANTTSTVQNFNWRVYIYRADTITHSDNETSGLQTGFPVGTGEVQSLGNYFYGPTGFQCEYFFARVGWLDSNNKITFFTASDGTLYQKGFAICDKNVIPTVAPAAPAPTAVPPPPGAGLFVTKVRLQPFATPQHNQATTFFPTFQNTANVVENFAWKVYVFRADTPNISNWETAPAPGSFAPGSTAEAQSANNFSYGATGYSCDYFFLRVGWVDSNGVINYFSTPAGQMFQQGFSVCN